MVRCACRRDDCGLRTRRREPIGHLLGPSGIVGVQVHRGRGERGVPQVVAHRGQLGAAFEQVRGMRVPRPVRRGLPQLLGRAGEPSSTISAAVAKNRFSTRHSRHEEIPFPSSPRLPTSVVDGRHFEGVTGSPVEQGSDRGRHGPAAAARPCRPCGPCRRPGSTCRRARPSRSRPVARPRAR